MLTVVSKTFPGCMGIGFNEAEALTDLKRSITVSLKEHVEAAAEQLFCLPIQEHVRLGKKRARKRVSFDTRPALGMPAEAQPHKSLMVSFPLQRFDYPQCDGHDASVEIYLHPDAPAPVRNLFEQLGLGMDLVGMQAGSVPHVSSHADGMIVGIPINLN